MWLAFSRMLRFAQMKVIKIMVEVVVVVVRKGSWLLPLFLKEEKFAWKQ